MGNCHCCGPDAELVLRANAVGVTLFGDSDDVARMDEVERREGMPHMTLTLQHQDSEDHKYVGERREGNAVVYAWEKVGDSLLRENKSYMQGQLVFFHKVKTIQKTIRLEPMSPETWHQVQKSWEELSVLQDSVVELSYRPIKTAKECQLVGGTVQDCEERGFSAIECKEAGYSAAAVAERCRAKSKGWRYGEAIISPHASTGKMVYGTVDEIKSVWGSVYDSSITIRYDDGSHFRDYYIGYFNTAPSGNYVSSRGGSAYELQWNPGACQSCGENFMSSDSKFCDKCGAKRGGSSPPIAGPTDS